MSDNLNALLQEAFAGKIVRKDLTKKIKEGANVPVYVLEYLLGMYCATDDEASIEAGVERVKSILADNFVRPDEAEKIKSKIRELSSYTVIDKVEARLDPDNDVYLAVFSNLNLKNVPINDSYIKQFEKLLAGGIWCVLRMNYNRLEERYSEFSPAAKTAYGRPISFGFSDDYDDVPNKKGGGKKGKISPFEIEELTLIQLAKLGFKLLNLKNSKIWRRHGYFD